MFGSDGYINSYFPNTRVRCARFQGEDKVHFLDQYDVEGTIVDAVDEVIRFIQRNTRLAASVQGMNRKDIAEYDPITIREVLINALVHADYSIQGMHIRVAIFSNRLEIESPGQLPYGCTIDDFFAGVSHVRNRVIARAFHELDQMEQWGTGYRRIQESCKKEGYSLPKWEEIGLSLKVTLYPHPATKENRFFAAGKDTREREIQKVLQEKGALTSREIQEHLGNIVAERTIRYDLAKMEKQGLVTKKGKGPAVQWVIKPTE